MYYLVDIGNSFAHIYDGKSIINLTHNNFFKAYKNKNIFYINVKKSLKERLKANKNWVDLSKFVKLNGSYTSMGIDRQVLLLSQGDGIYIDAGTAITIDKKINNKFLGGVILLGLWKFKEAYKEISPTLDIKKIQKINLDILPSNDTISTISYGIIAPIIALIEKINKEKLNIYITGGDGELLSSYIPNAIYKKDLIFDGMKNIVRSIDVNSCFT